MNKLDSKLESWIAERLFDTVPMSIAVIDRDFNLVAANSAFEDLFGHWRGKKCHAVYKSRDSVCPHCKGSLAFQDKQPQVNEEVGYNKDGKPTRYIKYTIPIFDEQDEVPFLVEMSTDITEADQTRRELQLLFDQVPCNITVLDRNLKVVRTNNKIHQTFGEAIGKFCYQVFKNRETECEDCPARRSFEDGGIHSAQSMVCNARGQQMHLHVTSAPLESVDRQVDQVVEMAVDITENVALQDELRIAHSFLETLIAASIDGVIAVDENMNVTVFNAAARKLCQVADNHFVTSAELERMFPEGFLNQVHAGVGHVYLPDTEIRTMRGEALPVRLTGVQLLDNERYLGMAFSIQNLTRIKQLEKANLDAERLAAVGQTVAGLAHGVKNLIAGLEGGMYMLNTGIKLGQSERIVQGWDILDRNIGRIGMFVKAFLGFSKGREIQVESCDPASIAEEVVQLYSANAERAGIELNYKVIGQVKPANLDKEGIHECLTNLVGNAIDACQMSDKSGCHVTIQVRDRGNTLIYEVTDDGIGMDYEVKRKVFTTFFTSKGLGGTGLGLLTTRKIVQEHGGRIDVESELNQGTTFRIVLRRERLPKPIKQSPP